MVRIAPAVVLLASLTLMAACEPTLERLPTVPITGEVTLKFLGARAIEGREAFQFRLANGSEYSFTLTGVAHEGAFLPWRFHSRCREPGSETPHEEPHSIVDGSPHHLSVVPGEQFDLVIFDGGWTGFLREHTGKLCELTLRADEGMEIASEPFMP